MSLLPKGSSKGHSKGREKCCGMATRKIKMGEKEIPIVHKTKQLY
jgi:hypothetical protein